MKFAEVELFDRLVVQAHAGVVDQPVDAPVTVERCGDEVRDLTGIGDVGLRAQRAYRRNGMSIFVLLLYSGYALGKVAARFRSSTIPQ
jgi:hypothetical protein